MKKCLNLIYILLLLSSFAFASPYPNDGGPFVDNGDGTVTDHGTWLMWQQGSLDFDKDGYYDWYLDKEIYNWWEARDHCEHLNFAGYNDWYLPSAMELHSLVNYHYVVKGHSPVTDDVFYTPYWRSYWSSTLYNTDYGKLPYVRDFEDGSGELRKRHKRNLVRCVRKTSRFINTGSMYPIDINQIYDFNEFNVLDNMSIIPINKIPSGTQDLTFPLEIPQIENKYSYPNGTKTIRGNLPEQCKPMNIEITNNIMKLNLDVPDFKDKVDLYLGIYAPSINLDVYLVVDNGSRVSMLSDGLKPWIKKTKGDIIKSFKLVDNIYDLPKGDYFFYLLVTPADSNPIEEKKYYLWGTAYIKN